MAADEEGLCAVDCLDSWVCYTLYYYYSLIMPKRCESKECPSAASFAHHRHPSIHPNPPILLVVDHHLVCSLAVACAADDDANWLYYTE